jgi:hypothetical protein
MHSFDSVKYSIVTPLIQRFLERCPARIPVDRETNIPARSVPVRRAPPRSVLQIPKVYIQSVVYEIKSYTISDSVIGVRLVGQTVGP